MRYTPNSSDDVVSGEGTATKTVIRRPWGWWAHLFLVHRDDLDPVIESGVRSSVDFCLHRAGLAPGARILDVGCGAGRHALQMARRGMKVTGIDKADMLVRHARERAKNEGLDVVFRRADWHEAVFEDRFDACFNLGISFGYEGIGKDCELLRRMADLLLPGGILIIENDNPGSMLPGWIHDVVELPEFGRLFMRRRWDEARSCFQGNFHLETPAGEVIELDRPSSSPYDEVIHVYRRDEMIAMIDEVGLRVSGLWGACILPPEAYHRASQRLVVEARKPC